MTLEQINKDRHKFWVANSRWPTRFYCNSCCWHELIRLVFDKELKEQMEQCELYGMKVRYNALMDNDVFYIG